MARLIISKIQHLLLESQAVPQSLIDSGYETIKEKGLSAGAQVFYKRGMKRITLQRILCSRIVHLKKEITLEELLTLYDNHIWLQQKSLIDSDFQKKFGSSLEELTFILKKTEFFQHTLVENLDHLSQEIGKNLQDFLIPQRNIKGVWKHFEGHFHVKPHKESGVPTKSLPPKAFIAKGYKDKGNRRDPAIDGSPSWQEVASSEKVYEIPKYRPKKPNKISS